jgi:hypothetical protein
MLKESLQRFLFFCFFFAAGLSALGVSIITNDLVSYFSYKALLENSQVNTEKLKSLNDDYDTLLNQLRHDPNLFNKIARVTFGIESKDKQTISPKARPEELYAAKETLAKKIAQTQVEEKQLPNWVSRIKQPHRRIALFLAGSVLIIISFVYFGPVRKAAGQE